MYEIILYCLSCKASSTRYVLLSFSMIDQHPSFKQCRSPVGDRHCLNDGLRYTFIYVISTNCIYSTLQSHI